MILVVLITSAIIVNSQITRTALAMAVYQSRTIEQTRSVERRALYGATRGLVPKWLFFKASHFRVFRTSLLLFFSHYSSVADSLVLPHLKFSYFSRHDEHRRKIALVFTKFESAGANKLARCRNLKHFNTHASNSS